MTIIFMYKTPIWKWSFLGQMISFLWILRGNIMRGFNVLALSPRITSQDIDIICPRSAKVTLKSCPEELLLTKVGRECCWTSEKTPHPLGCPGDAPCWIFRGGAIQSKLAMINLPTSTRQQQEEIQCNNCLSSGYNQHFCWWQTV